jgi:hypothetical protein
MSEDLKPINEPVDTTARDLNIKIALALAIMFAVGLSAGVYLSQTGFFG